MLLRVTLVVLVCFSMASGDNYQQQLADHALKAAEFQWEAFKLNHKKSYDTPNMEKDAKLSFFKNLNSVAEHNVKYLKKEVTYEMEINKFSDQEFVAKGFGIQKQDQQSEASKDKQIYYSV